MNIADPHWLAARIPRLLAQPIGAYGISYDVDTRKTENTVGTGWQARRSSTYRQIIKTLREAQFFRHQYSDYRNDEVTAYRTFEVMLSFVLIQPLGKIATTIKGLKMHYINDLADWDVTDEVILGGHVSRFLLGPTPIALVHFFAPGGQNLVLQPQPVPQGHPGIPPRYTSANAASRNVANYLM